MHHSIIIENYGVRLRPVRMEDAAFIVWLRNLDHARGMVGDSFQDVESQEEWLRAYFERDGDYYFIVETACGIPAGTLGFYDAVDGKAEAGRWIVWPEVHAAIPGVILGFDVAFDHLEIRRLRMNTVATNHRVLSLYQKGGCRRVGTEQAAMMIDGSPVDLEHYTLDAEDWRKNRKKLGLLARLAERQVRNWESQSRQRPCTETLI